MTVEFLERERAFSLWRAQFHPRHQAAQVSIAFPRFDQDGHADDRGRGANRDGQLGSDDRFDPRPPGGEMKPRRAIHSIAVEQRERGISERGRAFDQRFRKRSAIEK